MIFRMTTLAMGLLLLPATLAAQARDRADSLAVPPAGRIEQLEKRIEDLERTKSAQEDATRAIIRQAIEQSGSRINDVASFGGVMDIVGGRSKDYAGIKDRVLKLNSLETVFEVQMNEWSLASMVLQYQDGRDLTFVTVEGGEAQVPRVDLDTGFLTIGDRQRFPLYGTLGRMILPFGISTGDPIADVPTLDDPLTLEAFEMLEDGIMIGVGLPTPAAAPPSPVLAPTPVRPVALRPAVGALGRLMGYRPLPIDPAPPTLVAPLTPPPPIHFGVVVYRGNTLHSKKPVVGWHPSHHMGATLGFRTTGPWSVDVNVDVNSSVFDSRFFDSEYAAFLDQIGLIPGMAATAKAKLGPVGVVAEWNGALQRARFVDETRQLRVIMPRAWQTGLVYQFGWNPGAESPGAQGTYVAMGYSRTLDLAGVVDDVNGPVRVGALPREKFLLGVGEWVLDGLRVAVEYARVFDYPVSEGGTGSSGTSVFTMLTYDW